MSTLRPGICSVLTNDVVAKLKAVNICDILSFLLSDLEETCKTSGIPFKELVSIRRILLAQYSAFAVNGLDLFNATISSSSILSSGCHSLDNILDGGFYTAEVSEIVGETAAGKTQLCLSAASSVACETGQSVIYIDTCGGFSAERLACIAENRFGNQVAERNLGHVRCMKTFDVYSVIGALENIRSQLVKKTSSFYNNLKMVVVDNVASVIYPVLGGQQMDGHSLMVHLSLKLKQLATDFSLAVLISNNIVKGENETTASLGRTWSHVPHTRLMILPRSEHHSNVRIIKVIKSSRMTRHEEVKVKITEEGVVDAS